MTSSNTMQRVRLELHASKLPNVAGVLKGTSDPFCVLTLLANNPREKPRIIGKTEVVKNSLSPKWTTCFDLEYELGALQRINVGIYDEVRKSSRNKPMGSAQFEVGQVLGTRGNTKAKKLRRGGTLFCRITPAPPETIASGILRLTMAGTHLKNRGGLTGKSDPFLEISSSVNAAGGLTWHPVFRTQHINNNLNPVWKPMVLDVGRLCNGDLDRALQLQVWDWSKNGKHESMGVCETSVRALLAADAPSLTLRKKTKDTGMLVVKSAVLEGGGVDTTATSAPVTALPPPGSNASVPAFGQALNQPPLSFQTAATVTTAAASMANMHVSNQQQQQRLASSAPAGAYVPSAYAASAPLPPPLAPPPPRPSFVDYLTGGCEIEMSVAIDFTGSNGDPRQPGTLHYIHPDGTLNDYEKAITAVGSILARYDSDQSFPAWGFGAKYGGVIQHCFQIGPDAKLEGIRSVLEAYRTTFRTGLTMSGPTVFAEVIGLAASLARSKQEASSRIGQQAYHILLILSDGAVSNIEETKQAIHAAGDAPLSIVIVGIGDADFSSMHFLDNFQDNEHGGRDICQFVEFNKHKHDKRALTTETLDEIPDQLVDFFFSKNIKPLPPISGSQISLVASEPDEEDVDLSLDVNPDGEISLADWTGAPVYDDSKYDTMSTYVPSAPSAPSAPAPYIPQAQQPPSHAAYVPQSQPSYRVPAPAAHSRPQAYGQPAYGGYSQPPPAAAGAGAYAAPPHHGGGPVASAVAVPSNIFHVQVPQGVLPGSQLQVQNPVTRQQLIVTVPAGVHAGGTFAVQY